MANQLRNGLWVVLSFAATLLLASSLLRFDASPPERQMQKPRVEQLIGRYIDTAMLNDAQSREQTQLTMPDTAVVVLLGAIGCSLNQMKVLQHLSRHPDLSHPVLAVYADYLMNSSAASHESLILRRISQTTFPFLVSSDTTLSPRAMNLRTPQVVLVESGVITQVLALPPEVLPPLLPSLERLQR